MKYLQALFVLLLALVLAGFVQQNSGPVSLKYFGWASAELPLSLFMIIAFVLGYVMAVLLGFYGNIRNRLRAAGAEKELKKINRELEAARLATRTVPAAVQPGSDEITAAAGPEETGPDESKDREPEAAASPDPDEPTRAAATQGQAIAEKEPV